MAKLLKNKLLLSFGLALGALSWHPQAQAGCCDEKNCGSKPCAPTLGGGCRCINAFSISARADDDYLRSELCDLEVISVSRGMVESLPDSLDINLSITQADGSVRSATYSGATLNTAPVTTTETSGKTR